MVNKSNLDTPIWKVHKIESGFGVNTQTYREFIRESEKEFKLSERDIDNLRNIELKKYVEELDYLWTK